MNLAPLVVEAVRLYVLSGKLKKEDFQFSVEADGRVWDVYKVSAPREGQPDGQLAFLLDDQKRAVIGWFGPGNYSKEEIVKYIGMPLEVADA